MGQILKVSIFSLFLFLFTFSAQAANHDDVVINEVAWMGTNASYNDEWIELYNNTDSPIDLDGWVLKTVDGSPEIKLTGNISANDFYLLERSKDYTGALNNKGERLELYDNLGNLIDSVDAGSGWPAGDNQTKQTMERIKLGGWQTSKDPGGTPVSENSSPTPTLPTEELSETRFREETSVTEDSYESYEVPPHSYEVPPRKNVGAWWIAGLVSIFSAGVILTLKKRYNKNV